MGPATHAADTRVAPAPPLEGRMARAPLASRALLEWTLLRAARLGELVNTAATLQAMRTGEAPPGPALKVQSAGGFFQPCYFLL